MKRKMLACEAYGKTGAPQINPMSQEIRKYLLYSNKSKQAYIAQVLRIKTY